MQSMQRRHRVGERHPTISQVAPQSQVCCVRQRLDGIGCNRLRAGCCVQW